MGICLSGRFRRARPLVGGFAAVVVLAGCFGADAAKTPKELEKSPLFSAGRATPSVDLLQKVSVMAGTVDIAGPKGFCIDRTTLQDADSGAYVPLGACAALSKNPADPSPAKPAFLAASVLPLPIEATGLPTDPAGRMAAARAFLESDAGLAALSRSGEASTVTLVEIKEADDSLHILIKDTSAGLPDALSEATWRSFFELKGMLVTASVTAFADQKLDRRSAFKILRAFVAAIRSANAG
ncbi:hypothetical protein [uncultured Aliiroseovarius sp.]|uniref:hypothetical protein n=1 Tax=uncultured Aliiroseovarius sp. TaxID=1658783 RepID=UPI002629B91B|nr:hypothetical protein [uncultured Aliiroseovarius sp.]